jgi:hypothetical protein
MSTLAERRELWRRKKHATRAKAKALGLPLAKTIPVKRRPRRRLDKALKVFWPDWIARA